MTISFATDDAPVVTFHVLYVAVTVNIFLALQLPFFLCRTQIFPLYLRMVAAEDQLGVKYCLCLVKRIFAKNEE